MCIARLVASESPDQERSRASPTQSFSTVDLHVLSPFERTQRPIRTCSRRFAH